MRAETRDLDQRVYTDGKWVCFLLGQLLQNAARYRSAQPVVTLSARALGRRVELTVEDNGIGIPAHELPRIFDRGFTGSNGRSRGGSTRNGAVSGPEAGDCLGDRAAGRLGGGKGDPDDPPLSGPGEPFKIVS